MCRQAAFLPVSIQFSPLPFLHTAAFFSEWRSLLWRGVLMWEWGTQDALTWAANPQGFSGRKVSIAVTISLSSSVADPLLLFTSLYQSPPYPLFFNLFILSLLVCVASQLTFWSYRCLSANASITTAARGQMWRTKGFWAMKPPSIYRLSLSVRPHYFSTAQVLVIPSKCLICKNCRGLMSKVRIWTKHKVLMHKNIWIYKWHTYIPLRSSFANYNQLEIWHTWESILSHPFNVQLKAPN